MAKFKLKKRKIWGYAWFSGDRKCHHVPPYHIEPWSEEEIEAIRESTRNHYRKPVTIDDALALGWINPAQAEYLRQPTKERSTMTPEQELALIERATGEGKIIYPSNIKADRFFIVNLYGEGTHTDPLTYSECVALLATLCPPAPTWQDDEGWKGAREYCRNNDDKMRLPTDCQYATKDKRCCSVGNSHYCICSDMWTPPTNPATGAPYLTLAAWQADQPKPMRDMTEFEKGYVRGACREIDKEENCRFKGGICRFEHCPLANKGTLPFHNSWQAPQVPLNFTVER